jgi:DNA-binding IclR family transcriptional regulator
MNRKLQVAEESLLDLLRTAGSLTMDEISSRLVDQPQSELRAAVWTLRAEGMVDFDDGDGKLKAIQAHAVVR